MDGETINLMDQEAIREVIESHLDTDPGQFALGANPEWPVTAIATQLGLLQKARLKLPSWYAARCLFTARAFAQATNEAVLPTRRLQAGDLAIDLTSGLGTDVVHLAAFFSKVVYNDLNPELCALAQVNFRRLGMENIHISNASASDLLAEQEEGSVDLLFIDPDRRDAKGQRQAAFADCQPDVLQLMPAMLKVLQENGAILIKASPMLDVAEGIRQLQEVAPAVSAQVISVDNEVKEVLFQIRKERHQDPASIQLDWNRKGELGHFSLPISSQPIHSDLLIKSILLDSGPEYIMEPDVAFYKGRATLAYALDLDQEGLFANHAEGYFFSDHPIEGFVGKSFRIKAVWPYKPKKLKSELKKAGLSRMEIGRRYFDLGIGQVFQQLGLKAGGKETLLCTKQPDGNRLAVWCERIS